MRSYLRLIMCMLLGIGFCLMLPFSATAQVNAADFIDSMDIKGDLRVRYDYQDNDEGAGNDPKDRLRIRFRVGAVWQNPAENWEIAAGLATGGAEGNTSNATFSETEVFETGDIRLDYAYAKHALGGLTLYAGQHKNQFHSSMALWDSDVRPAGFTARYAANPLFITAGYFQVRYVDRDIAEMKAVQAGVDTGSILAAVAYYGVPDAPEFVPNVGSDYEYQIADFYTECSLAAGGVKISPFAQIFYNFGADGEPGEGALGGTLDPEEENLGWLVGVGAKYDRFSLSVAYTEIGADAAVQDIKDSDFGSGLSSTDVKGVKIGLGCKLTKHCEFATTAYYYEPSQRDLDREVDRYQIDLKYKF